MNGSLPCTASYLKPIDVEVLLGIVDLRLKPESLRNVSKAQFFGILLGFFHKFKTKTRLKCKSCTSVKIVKKVKFFKTYKI